ncbi:IclR family transcriptional regulator [Pseudonocardia endophytica]|uniref:Glycerol operon regulatory protein n=1 Tax=Pseudonocardia endophytica TaxID=401976 RepID=A0A4R1HXA8_PSEEN|nr:helix-turn-helix domain-containing protein [Pseudonocardia endophytica]TCK25735.1 IclR family transcriptional regulator [Pseudonocardia endophytica]
MTSRRRPFHNVEDKTRAGAEARPGSQSVRRALDLLSLVSRWERRGGLSVAAIAEETGLARPTTHRLLAELLHAGYLEQAPDRRYRLGPESYVVGAAAELRYGVQQQSVAAATRLAGASEDVAFVSIRRHHHHVCVHREEGRWPIRSHVLHVGDRLPLGVGAAGLAFLAALAPEVAAAAVAANEHEVVREHPHLTPDVVLGLVAAARERHGVAINRGLVVDDSAGISLVVPARQGDPVVALGIATISSRMQPERERWLETLLKREVEHLSRSEQ